MEFTHFHIRKVDELFSSTILELEQWTPPSHWPERDLVYDWIINKLFIRESVVLKVKYVITRVRWTFDPTVIMNNS